MSLQAPQQGNLTNDAAEARLVLAHDGFGLHFLRALHHRRWRRRLPTDNLGPHPFERGGISYDLGTDRNRRGGGFTYRNLHTVATAVRAIVHFHPESDCGRLGPIANAGGVELLGSQIQLAPVRSVHDEEDAAVGVVDRPGVAIPLKMQGVAIGLSGHSNVLGGLGSRRRDRRMTAQHDEIRDRDCEHAR